MQFTKTVKVQSPKNPGESVMQEVSVSDSLQYDYSDSKWIGFDTEFLAKDISSPIGIFETELDVIQIASEDESSPSGQRVEVIYVKGKKADAKLKALFTNPKIDKILHVFRMDLPLIENFIEAEVQGQIWDTKVMGKIVWFNTGSNSNLTELVRQFVNPKFKKLEETSAEWDKNPEDWKEEQFTYATEDVIFLKPVKDALLNTAERRNLTEEVTLANKIIPTLSQIRRKGLDLNIYTYP